MVEKRPDEHKILETFSVETRAFIEAIKSKNYDQAIKILGKLEILYPKLDSSIREGIQESELELPQGIRGTFVDLDYWLDDLCTKLADQKRFDDAIRAASFIHSHIYYNKEKLLHDLELEKSK